jgi:hypothetical protein
MYTPENTPYNARRAMRAHRHTLSEFVIIIDNLFTFLDFKLLVAMLSMDHNLH